MHSKRAWLAEAALVLGLTGLAAFLRIYSLEALPPGLHGDEAIAGIFAQRILREGWIGPYVNYALGGPAGILYAMAGVFKLFGVSPFTVRLTTALLGTAAIPLMYLLGRQMFNRRVGLIAASLLAASYWHIHFSRIAHPVVSQPLMEIAALYFLFLGLRGGRAWAFALSGAFLGLSAYTYHPFPLFVLAVSLVLIYLLLRERRRWRYYLPRLTLLLGTALLVALPFLQFLLQEGIPDRYRAASLFRDPQYQQASTLPEKAASLARKAGRAGASLLRGGNIDGVDGLGQRGLLDPLTGTLFLGGAALALWRLRDERYMLLLAGTGLGLLGGILSSDIEGQYRRIIVSLPFAILAAAICADALVAGGQQILPRAKRVAPSLLLAGSLMAVGYLNVNYYFRVLTPSPSMRWVFAEDLSMAIRYLRGLPPDTYVYFYSERWSWNYETRRFLLPDMQGENRSQEFGKLRRDKDRHEGVVYLLMPPYDGLLPQLESGYPDGIATEVRNGNDELAFQAYYLGPATSQGIVSGAEERRLAPDCSPCYNARALIPEMRGRP